jgi:pyridoxine 5-phosphate synthase
MPLLGVNIDHIATLRQARYREAPDSPNAEPSPLAAALAAEDAGAAGITAHLREDRRHIQDADIALLRQRIRTKLNLEMGNTPGILAIALRLRPEDVCLVPESRREVTTEGGLDCIGRLDELAPAVEQLVGAGIRVSLFIDPDLPQVEAAARLGAQCVELHTGTYANAADPAEPLARLHLASRVAQQAGLEVHAGHGLNYANVLPVARIPGLVELNIGHSIVARSTVVGFRAAVAEMCALLAA